ncbi:Cytochrome P450 [Mycena venus]|uniref:Cytochrome P450 n=1 Tax=Mycena venus TaxID=2733690 RepID=A0A8H7D2Z7_9AGAR|nr:Cytochrome P450 [Mycena venus]
MDAGLLRNLVEANMTQAEDRHHRKLTDDITAHSLSFAISLFALYPASQQKISEETLNVWPNCCPTTASLSSYKEDMLKLEYTLATFLEGIRLFPPAPRLGKIAQADTALIAHSFTMSRIGEIDDVGPFAVPVRTGSIVIIGIPALHMNHE